jgi:SAM-dependent methyltransferase/tetratricopeptide (TPR) repeat protein
MQMNQQAEALFQAAVEAHQRGDLGNAEQRYREVLKVQPGHSPACNNLGLCLATAGRVTEAESWFRQARAADPTSADAAVNQAQALQQLKRPGEALVAWREAAALLVEHMEPPLAAAMLAVSLNRLDEAIDDLVLAAGRTAQREGTLDLLIDQAGTLASRCIDAGELARGHRLSSLLLRIAPTGSAAVHLLEDCLRHARIAHYDASIRDDLLHYFRSDAVEHHELSRVAGELLCARYPALAQDGTPGGLAVWETAGVHRDPLLELLLIRGRVATPALERALTTVRQQRLQAASDGEFADEHWQRFATALALQCFTNEYIFSVTAEEERRVTSLEARIHRDPSRLSALIAYACYRSPFELPAAGSLSASLEPASGLADELLRRAVSEPMQERALREQLTGTSMHDAVSAAVQRQYEESPYPRWQNLERQPAMDITDLLGEEIPHHQSATGLAGAASILIAGCGTGEHALRVASRHPMCTVTAVDFSTSSLAYGMRKAAEMQIGNVDFQHRDILSITAEDGPFQLIESVGVLHHMSDPAAGLMALRGALAGDGVIKLGLYSRQARRHVNLARERIAELGLEPTPQGMRTIRQLILDGKEPQLEPLLHSLDFYAMSAIRDLLFHVQEHQFDVPGLRTLLDGCGLQCIGFQVSPATRARYLERFPEDPGMTDLNRWTTLENEFPDTFSGMYQFWCTRASRS